jgi:CHASE2 domain-containing sensor protein
MMAQLVSRLAEAHPKAIALDVLFSETTSDDDTALTTAIAKAGNVITAAQLIRADAGRIVWLRPLPSIQKAAAAVGHIQVSTDVDGVAGSFLVRQADDEGQAEWAMALETICVGDGARRCPAHEVPEAVVIGARTIPGRTEIRSWKLPGCGLHEGSSVPHRDRHGAYAMYDLGHRKEGDDARPSQWP